jgi:hypothetical protein
MDNINGNEISMIRNKHGKEIYLIERFIAGVMKGKYLMSAGTHGC